eukprot:1899515-Amphidinium_carterae.1
MEVTMKLRHSLFKSMWVEVWVGFGIPNTTQYSANNLGVMVLFISMDLHGSESMPMVALLARL